MNTRHVVCGSLFAFLSLSCSSQNKDVARTPSPEAQSAQTTQVDPSADPSSPDYLARRTAEYAQSMDNAIDHRPRKFSSQAPAAAPSLEAAPAHPSTPSEVRWPEKNPFDLSHPYDAQTPTPAPQLTLVPPAPAPSVALSNQQPSLSDQSRPRTQESREPTAQKAMMTISPDPSVTHIVQRAKDYPRDAAAQFDEQLYQFLQDRPVPELPALANLSSEDRELLATLFDGMSNFRSGLRSDANMLLSRKVRPLLEMADRIRNQSDLTLPNAILCKAVRGYGSYDPIDAEQMSPGGKALLYCEIDNFASQLNDKQLWETKLSMELTLYTDPGGVRAWHKAPQQILDTCRNRRHDFYSHTLIELPNTLPVGRYVLKVTVIDQQVNRVSESSVPITLIAR